MSIRAWNIQRALVRKLNDSNFLSFIKGNDTNILRECWFSKQFDPSDYDIKDSHVITIGRTKCKGGGICILIKKCIKHKISFVKTTEGSLVWLKLDNPLFKNEQGLYLCCAYISPAGTPYYTHYDCDLFERLESDLEFFSNKGGTCIIGDLNARQGTLDDVIKNDDLNQRVAENLEHLFHYPNDTSFPRKKIERQPSKLSWSKIDCFMQRKWVAHNKWTHSIRCEWGNNFPEQTWYQYDSHFCNTFFCV